MKAHNLYRDRFKAKSWLSEIKLKSLKRRCEEAKIRFEHYLHVNKLSKEMPHVHICVASGTDRDLITASELIEIYNKQIS